jgi:hypothetical protein
MRVWSGTCDRRLQLGTHKLLRTVTVMPGSRLNATLDRTDGSGTFVPRRIPDAAGGSIRVGTTAELNLIADIQQELWIGRRGLLSNRKPPL